ncbi:MAG: hypothetical protein AAGA56_07325 [Myxococcota bacterium]
MSKTRAAVLFGALLFAGPAAAHHGASDTPGGWSGTAAVAPQPGADAAATSRLTAALSYQKLVDREPTYLLPLGAIGDHVAGLDLSYVHAFGPSVAMTGAIPLLGRWPAEEGGVSSFGLGDIRLGARFLPWLSSARDASLGLGLEFSFPSGGLRAREVPPPPPDGGFFVPIEEEPEAPRRGAGDIIVRSSVTYVQRWFSTLRLIVEVAVATAFREEPNLLVDYGLNASWMPWSAVGGFLDLRTQTFLRDDAVGIDALQSQPRAAGDTMVTLSPGLLVRPTDGFILSASPQLPLTSVRTIEYGGSLAATFELASF